MSPVTMEEARLIAHIERHKVGSECSFDFMHWGVSKVFDRRSAARLYFTFAADHGIVEFDPHAHDGKTGLGYT